MKRIPRYFTFLSAFVFLFLFSVPVFASGDVILPETVCSVEDDDGDGIYDTYFVFQSLNIVPGQSYLVNYNGVESVYDASLLHTDDFGDVVCLGDYNLDGFFLYDISVVIGSPCWIGFIYDGASDVTLSITRIPKESMFTGLLSDLGGIGSSVMDMAANIAQTISSNPFLLFTVGFLFIGGCVGIFGRFLRRS